jgi:hypothetical protein
LRSTPVAVRRGGHDLSRRDQSLHLDQQRTGPLHRAEDHGPRRGPCLADEAGRGIGDLGEAALSHLEDADLAGGAEAVLDRAQGAEGPLPLPLEVQDAIDQMLEGAGPGQRALLGHVPDQNQGDVEPLGGFEQRRGRLAHRRRRCRGGVRNGERLDRVESAQAAGRSVSSAASTLSSDGSASIGTDSAASPRRSARRRTCAADSSPET